MDNLFSECLIPLINSISTHGWDSEITDEIPTGMIGRDGSIIKSGFGCHRLAIMQSITIESKYPIKIVAIHPKIHKASNLPENIVGLLKSLT